MHSAAASSSGVKAQHSSASSPCLLAWPLKPGSPMTFLEMVNLFISWAAAVGLAPPAMHYVWVHYQSTSKVQA